MEQIKHNQNPQWINSSLIIQKTSFENDRCIAVKVKVYEYYDYVDEKQNGFYGTEYTMEFGKINTNSEEKFRHYSNEEINSFPYQARVIGIDLQV